MDQFTRNLAGGLRRFAMAGVGAITLTVDKSREIINQLAARGEVSAAEGQAVCDDLQKKLTEQLSSFTQKLRTDYENLSFEQMLVRARKLSPEQKQRLIDALTKTPESGSDEPADESAVQEAAADEPVCETDESICESAPQAAADSAEAASQDSAGAEAIPEEPADALSI